MARQYKIVILENNQKMEKMVAENTEVIDILREYDTNQQDRIIAARIGNNLFELHQKIDEDCEIKPVRSSSTDGNKMYQRGLIFVLIRAAYEVLGNCAVKVKYSINKGIYITIRAVEELNPQIIQTIAEKMQEIIELDEPFTKEEISLEDAKEIFKKQKMVRNMEVLQYRKSGTVNMYGCGQLKDYFFGYMPISTGYLNKFELRHYMDGVILRFPTVDNPDDIPPYIDDQKIAKIFEEAKAWNNLIGVASVVDLNQKIENGEFETMIRVNEALHEKKIGQIADVIAKMGKRVILIAGPSSSGKTTFAQRLSIQLRVCGLKPVSLSTDDYFKNRNELVADENGKYNFEDIEAVDVSLFNQDLNTLLNGEEADLPEFDFLSGKKIYGKRKMKLENSQPIVIEGIHGLNQLLTKDVGDSEKFKIYISPLTALNLNDHNRLPTTDARLLRRMIRDNKYRGNDGKKTLGIWKDVRAGEEKNIFPFQEEADVMFNSTLIYETAVLKKYAEPLLSMVTLEDEEYSEARRLLRLLSYFISIDDESSILTNSIIKEFTGGGCFFK